MARINKYTCDMDGETEFVDGVDGTAGLKFSWGGRDYRIDLSNANRTKLAAFMDELTSRATPVPLTDDQYKVVMKEYNDRVRDWFKKTKGQTEITGPRISNEKYEIYEKAHPADLRPVQ